MDDIQNMFGDSQRPKTPVEEAWHMNQRQREYDTIRVIHPKQATVKGVIYDLPQKDFYVEFDTNQHQRVSYGQTIDIPRPRAERFVHDMKDYIVNLACEKLHRDQIIDRDKKGLPRYTDKYTENLETYNTQDYPKTNDQTVIDELYDQLWVGIVAKYRSDKLPEDEFRTQIPDTDLKSSETKALDRLGSKRVDMTAVNIDIQDRQIPYTANSQPKAPPVQSGFSALNQKLTPDDITNE